MNISPTHWLLVLVPPPTSALPPRSFFWACVKIGEPPPKKSNKLRRYPQQHPVLLRMPPCNFVQQSKAKQRVTAQSRPDRGPTAQWGPIGARRRNRGPMGAGQRNRGRSGPDGAIGARAGPNGAIPPTPANHIIAQRRFSLTCGLTTVPSKARRCQLGTVDGAQLSWAPIGARRCNRAPIGPRRCNRAPTWAPCVNLANRPQNPRPTQRETLSEPFLRAAP